MSAASGVTVIFRGPILREGHSKRENREFHIDFGELGIEPSGYDLINRFSLPLISPPSQLADWSREISEAEYIDLVGPMDIEALLAKHRGLRWGVEWRGEPGHEGHYGQVETVFQLVSEFKRGNHPLHYRLTVSDMGR